MGPVEEVNFARLCKLLIYCRNILWIMVLKLYVLPDELASPLREFIRQKHKVLGQPVYGMLKRISELKRTPRVNDFDIPMLHAVLRYVVPTAPAPTCGWLEHASPSRDQTSVGDDIQRIQMFHKSMCDYAVSKEIPNDDFTGMYKELCEIFERLDKSQHTKYLEPLKQTCHLPMKHLESYRDEFCQQATTYLKRNQDDGDQGQLQSPLKSPDKEGAVVNVGASNAVNVFPGAHVHGGIVAEVVHVHRHEVQDSMLKRIVDYSKNVLQYLGKMPFVETNRFRKCADMLDNNNMVTIVGKQGDGKTSTAVNLIKRQHGSRQVFLLREPSEWEVIPQDSEFIIFIDNIFGEHNFEENRGRQWEGVLPRIIDRVREGEGRNKLIIATRNHVLESCTYRLKTSEITEVKVQLGSTNLNTSEKQKILKAVLEGQKRTMSDEDIHKCVYSHKAEIGFPYICFLFARFDGLFRQKEHFFQSPFRFFEEIFNDLLLKEGYKLSLFLVFMAKDGVLESELSCETMEEVDVRKMKDVARKLGLSKQNATPEAIKKSMDELVGSLFIKDRGMYQFSHATVYEMFGMFMSKQYPQSIIKVCNVTFLSQCVRVSTSDKDHFYFIVDERNFAILSDRIIMEVTENKHVAVFSTHPALLNDDFIGVLFTAIQTTGSLEKFLTVVEHDTELPDLQHSWSNLSFCGHHVRQDAVSLTFLSKVLENAKCKNHCRLQETEEGLCWKCELVQEILDGACQFGHFDVYQKCIEKGGILQEVNIVDAVGCSCVKIVEDALSVLKNRSALQKSFLSRIQLRACESGHLETFNIIQAENPHITSEHLVNSVRGNCNTVIDKIASELKSAEPDDRMNEAMDLVCELNRYTAFHSLRKTKVKIKTKHLRYAVEAGNKTMIEDIVKELAKKKDNYSRVDQWLMQSLSIACKRGDYCLYNLVCSTGAAPTSSLLCDAVRGGCHEIVSHIIDSCKSYSLGSVAEAMVEACRIGDREMLLIICKTRRKPNHECLYHYLLENKNSSDRSVKSVKEMIKCIILQWSKSDFQAFCHMDATGELLYQIIRSRCKDAVEGIVNAFDDWSPLIHARYEFLEKAFGEVCLAGDHKMFEILRMTGMPISSEYLRDAARSKGKKSKRLVKLIIKDLQTNNPAALNDTTTLLALTMSGPGGVFEHAKIHKLINDALGGKRPEMGLKSLNCSANQAIL